MPNQDATALEADSREVKSALGRIEALTQGMNDQLRGLDDRVRRLDDRVGGLDDRVRRLDDRVGGLDDKVRRVEIDLAGLKGKVSQLPTAWMLFTGGSGLILTLFGASFALLRFGLPR